ncbi:MAG: T9SS type A sorting domain-containing protein, partial [Flavobacterium sp.]
TRKVPTFAGAVATSNTMLVKINLSTIYLAMSGYSTQLRYKAKADADWSIWSGNNNQNTYYYGTMPKDSLWRWYDSTKTPGTGPNNHPLLTDPTGKANYFNPASLYANLFLNLTPNTQYQFQMRGRCFTSLGAVIFSDTVVTSSLLLTKKAPATLVASLPGEEDAASKISDAVVYPNPGKGIFNVKTTGFTGNVLISVLSMNGKVVYSSRHTVELKQATQPINLSSLPSGNYLVEISDGTKKVSKQISIIK